MKNNVLASRIKNLRIRKGFSQEQLAEISGLSLRTIQRIENGETEPRGDSLIRLAAAFEVSPDEILDWEVNEDKGLLIGLNLSALSFIVFPLLGILVPLIIWVSKKDKIRNINNISKDILNFQITWVMLLFGWYILLISIMLFRIKILSFVSGGMMINGAFLNIFVIVFLYAYNIFIIILNTVRINNEKAIWYFPKIGFIRK
jgi:transcriptional regulator with XRE-family HTH domain